jgi:hypothetical protein
VQQSTVRKPCALSAKRANDFANRAVHSPLTTENEGSDEWVGCLGKRAPISHYRFAVPADRDVPSRSEIDALGTGI